MINLAIISWIFTGIILLVFVYAQFCLRNASNKLSDEQEGWKKLNEQSKPTILTEAENLIENNDFEFSTALREMLNHGQINLEQLPYSLWIQPTRYIAGIFVFIGLVGTISGLVTAITSLGGTVAITSKAGAIASGINTGTSFSLENWNHLLSGVTALLTGMQSAFICTLVGLLATIFLSAQNNKYLVAYRILMADISKYADKVLLPIWQMSQRKEYIQGLAEGLIKASERLSTSADNLSGTSSNLNQSSLDLSKKVVDVSRLCCINRLSGRQQTLLGSVCVAQAA